MYDFLRQFASHHGYVLLFRYFSDPELSWRGDELIKGMVSGEVAEIYPVLSRIASRSILCRDKRSLVTFDIRLPEIGICSEDQPIVFRGES